MGGFREEKGREIMDNFLEPLWERLNSDSRFSDWTEEITRLRLLSKRTYEKLAAGGSYSSAFGNYSGKAFEIYVKRTVSDMSDEFGSLYPCAVNGTVMPGVYAHTNLYGNVKFEDVNVSPEGRVQTNTLMELDGLYMFNRDTPVILEAKTAFRTGSGYIRKSTVVKKLYGHDPLFLKITPGNGNARPITYSGGGFATVLSHEIDMKMIKDGLDARIAMMSSQ